MKSEETMNFHSRKITEIQKKIIYAEKYKQLFGKGDTITKFRLWNAEKKQRKISERSRPHWFLA